MQPDLIGFTLIIDDIVRPSGVTYMEQLGGGGPQTMFGFQLIRHCLGTPAQLGLAAGVGHDLPPSCKAWLTDVGVDVSGLIPGERPTPRAWQLFEEDGTRTQVWRVPECPELYDQLRPSFDQLPAPFQSSRHYHLGIHAAHPPLKLLRALRNAAHASGGLLSVETYTCCDAPPPEQQLRELLSVVDIFSPNADEAASIVGSGSPQQLVVRLLRLGARLVALRMGEQGVLLARNQPDGTVEACAVPAVPDTRVVDVTGCGNAFCGGFLAGLDQGLSLQEAGVWGCVAGSIMAEAQGVPDADVRLLLPAARDKQQQLLRVLQQQQHVGGLALLEDAPGQQRAAESSSSSSGRSSVSAAATAVRAHGGGCSHWFGPVATWSGSTLTHCQVAPLLLLGPAGGSRRGRGCGSLSRRVVASRAMLDRSAAAGLNLRL